jgi:hypothetical protein
VSVIKEDLFCEIVSEPLDSARRVQLSYQVQQVLDPHWHERRGDYLPVDRTAALAMLEQCRAVIAANGRIGSKGLRPHNFDNFPYLDRSKPWWGFEFETGWRTAATRSEAIHAAWDIGINGVTFDGEGEGNYVCEITFAPATMEDVINGSAPASQFVQYMNDHPEAIYNSGGAFIGTHLNVSFPTPALAATASVLNNSIALLPITRQENGVAVNTRLEFFGRSSIYGGFFQHLEGGNSWLEGKCFRTTYSMETFQKYCRVGEILTQIGMLVQSEPRLQHNNIAVSNLLEMFLDPSVQPVFVSNPNYTGVAYRSWISGGSNIAGIMEDLGYSYNPTAVNTPIDLS